MMLFCEVAKGKKEPIAFYALKINLEMIAVKYSLKVNELQVGVKIG